VAQDHLDGLNAAQREAAAYGVEPGGPRPGPLLIIAGAGTGKTNTLAHRVAHLLGNGADPRRILLLTFTRRAAAEMIRRAQRIAVRVTRRPGGRCGASPSIRWAGTFHAVANRLLRLHAKSVGLDEAFTVLDRSDAEDLMNLLRSDRLREPERARFPRKSTCLAIYSHVVNAQRDLEEVLARAFPWCAEHADSLRRLFGDYVEAKQTRNVLDYDDLLLYWFHLMGAPELASRVRERFDHVLVDEYQDTNALQAAVLHGLCPSGEGLTVVGDDAQSIYSFRAASVRNILGFPDRFVPPARVVKLEENYRSTGPILEACNAVMERSSERHAKRLFSRRASLELPGLVSVADESGQVDFVVDQILRHRESGIALQQQAVLMRASHHSDALEVELSRRGVPFVKYGGLKFLEAAHVKDLICVLRWSENPRDELAAHRVLQLLPGIGPATARALFTAHAEADFDFSSLAGALVPAAARADWPAFCDLLAALSDARSAWTGQLRGVRQWYQPHLERIHDAPQVRAGDLEQLEQLAGTYESRERFLTELTLDPPGASADEAGDPHLDEDFLILSTIHSAKGQEWDAVFVLNVVDGCIPSDMASGRPEEIEEERRLLYVAMSRARDHLHLVQPLRFHVRQQRRHGDAHVFAARSRFLPDAVLQCFERSAHGEAAEGERPDRRPAAKVDVAAQLRRMWS
jgi:DNA helicase-2/ATP-dependent DNA helicase PcrA